MRIFKHLALIGAMVFLTVGCGSDKMTIKGSVVSASAIIPFDGIVDILTPEFPRMAGPTTGMAPANFKIKIYKVGFSLVEACTDMTVVSVSETPEYSDWSSNPTLATTDLADGTYPCVAFEFNSLIKFTPAVLSHNEYCNPANEVDLDVGDNGTSATLLDGSSITMTGTEDRVTLYISTGKASGDPCGQTCGWTPADPSSLTSALVVSGTTSGAFTVDAATALSEQSMSCEMDEPTWGFQ